MEGVENPTQGDFGEAWVEVIAAAAGMDHGRFTPDRDMVDVEITLLEELPGLYHPSVKVQAKTQRGLMVRKDGTMRYRLDRRTYDFLRRPDHTTPRVLAVFGLHDSGTRLRLAEDGTLLCGVGLWVSLRGKPDVTAKSVLVELPAENKLDVAGLREMIVKCGVRQSTAVPDENMWAEP